MVKNKKIVVSYLINDSEIQFTNYLNKVIKKIKIRKILKHFRKEIEEMAETVV